ncbi:MAG: L-threonylcarbamoyladenylate synthase [Pacificibacter sp.]|uniref:L-threonylcarbamoyladenylate synthase n=1 Tax=Pacificibacter sp. TaxID=1917866 RepID=UPI003219FA15
MTADPRTLAEAKSTLLRGGVLLLATDTVLGLAALPSNRAAVDKVFALKQRAREKNLPIMVASSAQLSELGGHLTPSAQACLDSDFMPGALTIAVGLNADATPDWLAGRAECAIRIPNDTVLLALLTDVGPLLVTSANIAGQETPQTTKLALAELNGTPDYVLHGTAKSQTPSTLVNCRVSPAKIERIGAVPETEINAILERADD